jgi:FtsP/CotA-like multicopper oxidase with cupredoxin domain
VGERPATDWYHDHLLDFTGPNVYRGLAGFYLVFDNLDTGNETTGLRLPSGSFDVPLAVQDKSFNADGTLFFDPFNHDGFLGDKFLVNGAIQPFFNVKRRKYRFRFLNGSLARFYQLYLTKADGRTFPFDQIATEGGLFSAPIRNIRNFQIGPAQRVDVVIDFTQFQSGDSIFIENRLQQTNGRKPDGLVSRGTQILKFIIGESVPDTSHVPDVLRPFPTISQAELAVAERRTLEFNRSNGAWTINGRLVDPDHPLFTVRENTPQLWRLVNKSGGWWHPIHIHVDFLRVITRNGQLPPLDERDGIAKRDTVTLRDGDQVEVFLRFQDFRGPFTFHCHNVTHEDMAMMARFDIV